MSVYIQRRDSIVTLLHQTACVAEQLGEKGTAETIANTTGQLMDDKFNIVVLGEFSRGKSTVINALLGSMVLPSSVKPTTTILNKIFYNESPIIRLVYRNIEGGEQKIEEITQVNFKKIKAPEEPVQGDEESWLKYEGEVQRLSCIEYAEIGYPSDFCKDGVEIVDTPGTNDLDSRREEIANGFIPKSDAVILVLSARQPLAASEMNFLRERILSASIQKIFFVINFKDTLANESDEFKILRHIKKNLEEFVPDPRMFLISAKGALNYRRQEAGESIKIQVPSLESTGYVELESELSRFLIQESGVTKLMKPVERGLYLLSELKSGLVRLLQGLGVNENKYKEQSSKIKHNLDEIRWATDDAVNGIRTGLLLAGEDIKQEFKRRLEIIAYAAVESIDTYSGPLTNLDIARAIESKVAPMQTELSARINCRLKEAIEYEIRRASQRFGFKWETLDKSFAEMFVQQKKFQSSVSFSDHDDEVAIPTFTSAAGLFALAGVLTGGLVYVIAPIGGLGFWILFESKYKEKKLGKIRVKVDARYHDTIKEMVTSFEKQWNDKTNIIIEAFNSDAQRRINTVETQLDSISRLYQQEKSEAEKTRQFFKEQSVALDSIYTKLHNMRLELNCQLLQ